METDNHQYIDKLKQAVQASGLSSFIFDSFIEYSQEEAGKVEH